MGLLPGRWARFNSCVGPEESQNTAAADRGRRKTRCRRRHFKPVAGKRSRNSPRFPLLQACLHGERRRARWLEKRKTRRDARRCMTTPAGWWPPTNMGKLLHGKQPAKTRTSRIFSPFAETGGPSPPPTQDCPNAGEGHPAHASHPCGIVPYIHHHHVAVLLGSRSARMGTVATHDTHRVASGGKKSFVCHIVSQKLFGRRRRPFRHSDGESDTTCLATHDHTWTE